MNQSSIIEPFYEDFENVTTSVIGLGILNTTSLINDSIPWIEHDEYTFDRNDVRIMFFTIYTIVFCSCFFGNLMVILVVTLHWRMRSLTNFCLANLAFADLCVGVFCIYQNMIGYFTDNWVFGDFMCKMYHFINTLSHTASVIILVVICIERYLAILHPMHCKQILTHSRMRKTIILAWIISAAYSSPRFYYINVLRMPLTGGNGSVEVMCIPNRGVYNSKMIDLISMCLLFFIPLLVISILYFRIGMALWRSTSNNVIPYVSNLKQNLNIYGKGYKMNYKVKQPHRRNYFHCNSNDGTKSWTSQCICVVCCKRGENGRMISNVELGESGIEMVNHCAISSTSHIGICIEIPQEERDTRLSRLINFDKCITNNSSLCGLQAGKSKSCMEIVKQNSCTEGFSSARNGERELYRERSKSLSIEKITPNYSVAYLRGASLNDGTPRTLPNSGTEVFKGVRRLEKTRNSLYGTRAIESRRKTIRMLIVIVLAFALCNLPIHARKMWQYFGTSYSGGSVFSSLFTPLTFVIMYANCGINPILYAFMSQNFRLSFHDLLVCKLKRSPPIIRNYCVRIPFRLPK